MNPDDELLEWIEDEIRKELNKMSEFTELRKKENAATMRTYMFDFHKVYFNGRMYAFVDVRKQMIKRKMGMTFWKKHIEEMPFVAENNPSNHRKI